MYLNEINESEEQSFCLKKTIEKAKAGDEEAFISLIENYKLDLYRMGKSILDSDEDVGDAMQETVLKAFRNIKKLEKAESFKSWLIKVMVNECNNILRQKKKFITFDKLFKEEEYTDNYNLDKHPVLQAIRKLDEEFRKVVMLYYYEDFCVKDISETLEISEGTVKSRLSRARKKLFVLLKGGEF
ncbi:MAG: RNA polymerase sigma factor [Bacillota bacterium]|nr:RNA polymerase sigma factor [Bacillota bacterium]